ncbi:membrane protein insertase YidC [Oceanospirillaceae bacterium]|jgi:YidC/Oxa1 family membrane protein insertase|uniref:membrane protein insertase YidC n=1 Tax=Candidatus Njordibacter sp. Uisw_002 TaxID=3230971 RepID=UPI002334B0E8|nr:membrane protein insertase YidC [Oceanospirillaceae bacterium]MDB9958478.1 membrane protein insertase YidC [Oceanospirillaceae bacterium]|tara:strand:+ start:2063 stop:3724 length:1662 start_codon:yes stop_codon:yes gene_type:complete
MDFQRIILIAGVAIISYLMVLQWNQDYGTQAIAPQQVTSVSAYDVDTIITDFAVATQPGNNSDIVVAQAENAAAGSLIEVSTDTLKVVIDTQGGDIIQASLVDYLAEMEHSDVPFTLLEQNQQRTYVAQSGLIGVNGTDLRSRPIFNATQPTYQLQEGQQSLEVILSLTDDTGALINKIYTFSRGSHLVNLTYAVDNRGTQPWSANLFGQLKRDRSADPTAAGGMGMSAYLGAAFSFPDEKYYRYDFDDMDDENLKRTELGGWVGMLQHYFVTAWVPNPQLRNSYSTRVNNNNYIAGFVSPALELRAGESGTTSADFYAGPKIQADLEAISENLDLVVDYGWLWWISQPLFWLLNTMYGFVGNWGVAIMLTTLCVKAFFFYPSAISYRSMAKMRALAPEIAKLKEKFGDDRAKMSQGMMELYKREKANPLSGCFPIIIQMPVFIGLYWMLMETVELRHAPFMLWIHDLSVQDPYFVLPLLMGATMFVQQTLNPTPPDPMQAKIMKMLPIVFTVFFLWFPAALVLYWVTNNILSITQQYVITKRIEKTMAERKS